MSLPTYDRGLQFVLLGGFDARLNGQPVAGFAYNKMRALLAYLAIERGQEHRREVLAELFWGGIDPASARGNLRRTLSDLRRVLELPSGATLFSTGKHSIRFIPDARIDVLDFAGQNPALNEEQIVALYRGEFLAGLSLPDSPEFEDWLQIQRETLHRRALALLEQLANRYEQTGDYDKALKFALRLTELEPWDENAHRKAMLLYALNGQNGAAIRQYDTCCQLLKNELAALPDEETRHLAERIRSGELRRESLGSTNPPRSQEPAERRQVTVLYCELSIDAVDDPDEVMDLLLAPQARCIEIVRQFSGHIVQTHGGGLLAYFGYPQAREDAAHRAVKAALSVIREAGRGVEVRVGIHTGLIITGGELSLPDTSGRTSKIAIQIRKMAAHNEVAISQTTRNIVAGYFDCISLGAQPLSGQTSGNQTLPLEIFKVLQESGARTRLDAAAQLTPLSGREAEIADMVKLWQDVAQGARHEVLIQGEAGIGKSRLLLALKDRLVGQPHAIRELRCFPEFSLSPFYPLIAMLEGILNFAPDDTAEQRFAKLAAYLEEHFPASAENATPLLAALLSLPLSGDYRASGFSPQKQKEQTNLILIEILHALARRQPVLLIVEDLHWIDPSTLELLTAFLEQDGDGGGAILTLLTARPEFVPPWKKTLKATLVLPPLAGDEVAKMVASISADIPADVIRSIVERADGVPLFVEEVAKIANMDNQTSIPSTLHDLLAARMDNMGEAKYTAQLAATIGREFDLNLMRKVSPDSPAALAHSLSALQDAGLILKVSDTTRQFKHALIQEAAYQSQARTKRQDAHRRIAQALLSDFPEVVGNQPELLAQHFASGGETPQAIEYWIKAGQRAARYSANAEAIEHFNDGLKLLKSLPPGKEHDHLESRLHLSLGPVLIATTGYGSVEVGQTYARALELCERLGDNEYMALWGMWLTSSSRVGHSHSLTLAKKLLRLAEQSRDTLQLQLAHYALGNSSVITGDLTAARSHLESSMALYKPEHHEILVSQYGENSYVSSGSLLSTVLWLKGFPAQAQEISRQTVAMARQINHPNSLGYALCVAAMVQRWLNQIEPSAQFAHEAMALSHQHGLPFWLGFGASAYGWVMVMQGQPAGIVQMQQCVAAVNAVMSGSKILFLAPLNDALVHLGKFENALTELDETLFVVAEKDDRFLESEFNRLKGECLLQISPIDTKAAEACFDKALAISRQQGAKSLELRAAMSVAQVWQKQGKTDEARQLLEEIRQWFTEGHDTSDLREAADLLRSLG